MIKASHYTTEYAALQSHVLSSSTSSSESPHDAF